MDIHKAIFLSLEEVKVTFCGTFFMGKLRPLIAGYASAI